MEMAINFGLCPNYFFYSIEHLGFKQTQELSNEKCKKKKNTPYFQIIWNHFNINKSPCFQRNPTIMPSFDSNLVQVLLITS